MKKNIKALRAKYRSKGLSPEKEQVIQDARNAEIYDDGYAMDLTVEELQAARAMRSARDWRSVLGI